MEKIFNLRTRINKVTKKSVKNIKSYDWYFVNKSDAHKSMLRTARSMKEEGYKSISIYHTKNITHVMMYKNNLQFDMCLDYDYIMDCDTDLADMFSNVK